MKKRILSLLCVLALCLGLLPVTALAEGTAPQTLYVGSTTITAGYWTSSDGGTTWTNTQQSDPPSGDSYIHYNGQGTLELHNATIQGGSNTGPAPFGSGIYALSSSGQPVALTIELIGTNTITGNYGIYVDAQQGGTVGTNASLLIQNSGDDGSLEVSGSSYGIYVKSGTGDASLTIKNASVDAKTTQIYSSYAGVCVQSGASTTDSPNISLSVNGGSLTASASEGNDGIQFYVGNSSASATTSLTVSENAIVDARNGGIKASDPNLNNLSDQIVVGSGTGTNGGIVFDGKNGTVYGEVTLQENLTIGEGETLTFGDGASLDTNGKTITVESGGKLEGTPTGSGTVKIAPTITTESLPDGEVGTAYSQTLVATGDTPITWTVSGTLPADLSLDAATGIISGTPTAEEAPTFTVTATNASGSDSKEYTIQIAAKSDTTPPMLTAGTVNRTSDTDATVTFTSDEAGTYFYEVVNSGEGAPADITSGTIYTLTSDTNIITLTNLTAGAKDIYIVAKDAAGNQSATLKIEIPTYVEPVYSISADTELDFGSVYTGYAQPAAQTVTITNNGNQPLTLTQPASTSSFVVGTLSTTSLPVNGTATFTVQPKAGLAVGTYSENITVSGAGGATVTITANFTVKQYSSGGGTPTKTPSQQATDKIESAKEGSTVEITLRTGQTKLDKEGFEALAGRDVTLEISLPGGVSWTVNGQDIPTSAKLTDIDMGVSMNTSTIPVDLINAVTGEIGTVQLTLKHNGEFGFTMTLTAPVGVKNAGLWANLYHFDEDAGKMVYQTAALVDEDGNVALPFDHASQYALVLDSKSHDLPFTDLAADAWYTDAVAYVYRHDLMAGYGENLFGPDDDLSRAQLCQIIYNMEGQPATSGSSVFTDVADGAWYADAVTWAASQGIVGGYGNGLFGPEDNITREQLAAILYRYAQAKGYDTSVGENTNILSYTDALEISEYAIPAMQWACGSGLVEGSNGSLNPRAKATRAEVATMLMRWMEQA